MINHILMTGKGQVDSLGGKWAPFLSVLVEKKKKKKKTL